MSERLERYLREIDQYLPLKHSSKEILAEIRSHILEKAEADGASEEAIVKAIAGYGGAREVAEKYLEGTEIIAPAFRKYLWRYTWILFAAHLCLTIVALATKTSIAMFPFFIIPRMPVGLALLYVPMAFIADFGLVALFLYVVTQKGMRIALPLPRFLKPHEIVPRLAPPKRRSFVLLLLVFAAAAAVFARYGTLFFYVHNTDAPRSLLDAAASVYFSIMFLSVLACFAIAAGVRLLVNSAWVNLARDAVILLVLWIVWNSPVAASFVDVPGIDLRLVGAAAVAACTVVGTIEFLKSLVRVVREMQSTDEAERS